MIPKFVAKWIEEVKPDNSLRVAFEYIAQRKRDNYDDELAFWVEEGNSETFARAWLDGYEVEEEQKYYVLDKEGNLLIRGYSNGSVGRVGDRMKPDLYPDWNKKNLPLTEQEIKDYDERFWPFAVKVEEMEE